MKRQAIGILCVALGLSLGAASCDKGAGGPPALPDFSSAQRAVWQLAPDDTVFGMVFADFGHSLERLRATRAVLATGPVTKTYLDKGMAAITLAVGFDPLDAEAWKQHGVDPAGPIAFFIGAEKRGVIVFKVTNADAAKTTATAWYTLGGTEEPFECGAAGAYYRCGTPTWKLAEDPAKSLWPHVEKNLPASHRGMEIIGYAPLDQGEAKKSLEESKSPVKGLHAGYMAMTFAPERVQLRMGAKVDDAQKVLPYFQPRSVPSLLGIAGGGVSAGRMTFSPDAVLALAKKEIPEAQLTQGLGIFQGVAGFDLEKDVIDNLTGEIVSAGYRADKKTGADGKPLPYSERLGSAMVVGTRNDATTRKIADRIGELAGGAIGQFGDAAKAMGITPTYRADAGDRKVHWFAADLDAERQKIMGAPKLEVWLTSIPGGLAMGFGPVGLEELKKRASQKPAALLDKLPLREERALFEKSPAVFWGLVGEGYATQMKLNAAKSAFDAFDPNAGKALMEMVALGQLVFDAVAAVEISADRADLFYQLTFL